MIVATASLEVGLPAGLASILTLLPVEVVAKTTPATVVAGTSGDVAKAGDCTATPPMGTEDEKLDSVISPGGPTTDVVEEPTTAT